MITLYKTTPAWGLRDLSPFCLKLETWLRMAEVPYRTALGDPRRAPKGKLPYVDDDDGRRLADSGFIVAHLAERLGDPLDGPLRPRERACAAAFRGMLEEQLYWVLVHLRWRSPEGWRAYRPVFGALLARAGVPAPLRAVALPAIRRRALRQLHQQGTGRHADAEVNAIGVRCVSAVADFLGDSPFLMGERPSSVDASAYAFTASLVRFPAASAARDHARRRANLVAYLARMEERFLRDGPGAAA